MKEECSSDQEFLFSESQSIDGKTIFMKLKYDGNQILQAQSKVKLRLTEGKDDLTPVMITGFIADKSELYMVS